MVNATLIKELKKIVGDDYVMHHADELLVFQYDGSTDKAIPDVVVFPKSAQEISSIVIIAKRYDQYIIPRGAGTGLSGGAVPMYGGIELVLTRMNSILSIDRENRLALVEPGVVNLDLSKYVAYMGLFYAPDPSSQISCTIGGNIAENSGGPHCLKYGVTTNHVFACEIVTENGEIIWLGDKFRNVPGYDLLSSFVGSEGMMGVATKIIVNLLPIPQSVKTHLASFATIEQASFAVSTVISSGLIPGAIEMMDKLTIEAVENVVKCGYPDTAGAVLLIEVDGDNEEVNEQSKQIMDICNNLECQDITVAASLTERNALWRGRKGALGALGSLAPNYFLVDGVVPRTKLPETLRTIDAISNKIGLPIANVFHAGDGNLHPCILFDEQKTGMSERVLAAGGEILQACVDVGGTLTGEHGVGFEKKEFMYKVFSNSDLDQMLRLKSAFAPDGRLNPGKVFPGGPKCFDMGSYNTFTK